MEGPTQPPTSQETEMEVTNTTTNTYCGDTIEMESETQTVEEAAPLRGLETDHQHESETRLEGTAAANESSGDWSMETPSQPQPRLQGGQPHHPAPQEPTTSQQTPQEHHPGVYHQPQQIHYHYHYYYCCGSGSGTHSNHNSRCDRTQGRPPDPGAWNYGARDQSGPTIDPAKQQQQSNPIRVPVIRRVGSI